MQATQFIQSLPKAELHLHFEGSLPWAMIQAKANKPLPDSPPWWAKDFLFDNFSQFIEALSFCYQTVLTDIEQYHLAAQAVFETLLAQNVRYVEISFGARHVASHGYTFVDVVDAIKQAAPPNLHVAVVCGISRIKSYTLQHEIIQNILSTPNLDGLDLHGDETVLGAAYFTDIFALAKENGLFIKAHAGELVGPDSIKETLDCLKVKRIEHGATAIESEDLMTRLATEKITLDMSPWSNVRLRVVDSINAHPIREFHQRGIPVTVNTDDPTIFGYSLTDELYSLFENLNFSLPDLAQLQVNAFQVAKMPSAKRQAILTEIENLVKEVTIGT